jgi:hypothetical protein
MKNKNRTFGNYIIIRTAPDGTLKYYNWAAGDFIAERSDATGYHTKGDAAYVMDQLNANPAYTWKIELDK